MSYFYVTKFITTLSSNEIEWKKTGIIFQFTPKNNHKNNQTPYNALFYAYFKFYAHTLYKYITTQIKIEIWGKYKAKNQYQFITFYHIAQKYK